MFESLGYLELVKVLNIVSVEGYAAGGKIIREGAESDKLFIVLDGAVAVSRRGQKLADLHPGSFFGEMGLIDDSPRSADVTATRPSKVLALRRDDFHDLLHKELTLSPKILM